VLPPGSGANAHVPAVHAVPSTLNAGAEGVDVMELVVALPKIARTFTGWFIVTLCGLTVPVSPPLKPVNGYPEFGVAVTWTTWPLLYQPLAGPTLSPSVCISAVDGIPGRSWFSLM